MRKGLSVALLCWSIGVEYKPQPLELELLLVRRLGVRLLRLCCPSAADDLELDVFPPFVEDLVIVFTSSLTNTTSLG